MSLAGADFLLWGDVSPQGVPLRAKDASPVAAPEAPATFPETGGRLSAKAAPAREAVDATGGKNESAKTMVMFIPKPEPWNRPHSDSGKALNGQRPASFCRKAVTFTPTPNPMR